jgi:murein DD-endopeptidase MepM/ murein hydrolase activator NlpD
MSWRQFHLFCLWIAWTSLAYACSPPAEQVTVSSTVAPTAASASSTPTATLPSPTQTFAPATATPTIPPPTPESAPQVCSPLQDYSLADLPAIVSNPYNPPAPGSDDPHQGVDLAQRLPGSQAAVPGMGVQALLDGQVAGIIADRFPYGYAVLVETPLERFPAGSFPAEYLPDPLPQPLVHPSLTCPLLALPYSESADRSLYVLYAHLQSQPFVSAGQEVRCGESLGAIGQSGNALHPHLHLEVRVGPAGARFNSLAHYDNRATQEEMGLYCLWRVSGIFQVVDPMPIFSLQP